MAKMGAAFVSGITIGHQGGLTSDGGRAREGVGPSLRSAAQAEPATAVSSAAAPCGGLLAGAAAGAAIVVGARLNVQSRRAQKKAVRSSGVARAVATVAPPVEDASASAQDTAQEKLEEFVTSHGGAKPLRRILIANNGMAATKAILSMKQWAYLELGLETCFEFVVMATREDLDANAEFIRLADTYVEVPAGKNANNYANVDLICEVAKAQCVDAVWPGWGHASENPRLPRQLTEIGVTFIGPTAPVMSVLGDKIAANILAQTAGVPSIPWSGDGLQANLTEEGTIPDEIFKQGLINTLDQAIECANRIGYPMMLKASEGGGGKGIRMCADRGELEQNYPQVLAEVPGSPVFAMQLCQGARHIEVQIVGDMHGNAVALNGRDCSTQRRFQKIFEEAPPAIVPKATFREMEKAAQRLTQSIGYIGAGTVEFLYNATTNDFYFLELNPRLQVEHPCTEEVTGVNLPATQLQVLMGIPLHRIPQIRAFYGKAEDDATSPIDFLEENYVYPKTHVIAARITAENPDDGFKPTSGKIERIKFQSSVNCWGYFSVGSNGAIHEFADSQFGHIFARGKDREQARKNLTLALKQLEVVGEIRFPGEYLVELANTQAFKDNTITTSWLDELIKQKSVKLKYNNLDVVFYAAVYRAMNTLKETEGALLADLQKSQLGLLRQVGSMNSFPIEITFEGYKYEFNFRRTGPDQLVVTIGDTKIACRVRTQADESIFVTVGNSVMKVTGQEEALGLRLRLAGIATIMIPTIYDPSELRSEFNGKVVRYLQAPGATVREGEPYVELEAMKMIMPIKAGSTGKISQLKGAGSIVSAGELLAQLELDDPSAVQKIEPYSGPFELNALSEDEAKASSKEDPMERIKLAMAGYMPSEGATKMVQEVFSGLATVEEQAEAAQSIFETYLKVEESFLDASSTKDQVQAALIAQYKDNLSTVVELCMSHSQLPLRSEIVLATLRSVESITGNESLAAVISQLAELPTKIGYDEVVLEAGRKLSIIDAKPFKERADDLRDALKASDSKANFAMSQQKALQAGVDLLSIHLKDEDATVRKNALETYVMRAYRGFRVEDMEQKDEGASRMSISYRFQYPGSSSEGSKRRGYCVVVPTVADIKGALTGPSPLQNTRGEGADKAQALNALHVIVAEGVGSGTRPGFFSTNREVDEIAASVEGLLRDAGTSLEDADVREVCIMLPQEPHYPRYLTFLNCAGWKEEPTRRDMRPTFPHLLEVSRLAESYDLERIVPTIGRNSQVYLGTQKGDEGGRLGKQSTIFVRMISHAALEVESGSGGWMAVPESCILQGVDEVERAGLGQRPGQPPNSHVYLHLMSPVDLPARQLAKCFEQFMNKFVSRYGARLQRARVDEIVVKVGVGTASESRKETLRFTASSMSGEYLKTVSLLEVADPVTGKPVAWFDVDSNAERAISAVPSAAMQKRRSMARRAGSTYAPEFLGMLKVGIIQKWDAYTAAAGNVLAPADAFKAVELVLSEDGQLEEVSREPGSNDVGMMAWRCTMQTPEYPDGRDIVLIANDVTHQAGSFGVKEDVFFQKASAHARERGLPRIYISCNSGARVGLVEELKPHIQVKWTVPDDPSKGYDYLYLSEQSYRKFGEGVVAAHKVTSGEEVHYAIDAIIGQGMASTAGGIGVENLQGSALIAGETSRAYDEVFTLSYITGRSVGIGAYLNRLGQRTIQMVNGPMILTGFAALNKLLGRSVYTSQDQLGGPQVMVPNGVTHQLVQSDQEGVQAILDWLSYVPKDTWSQVVMPTPVDPPERPITFVPSKVPYDPRHMLAGATAPNGARLTGFFDEGSFKEYLAGWGRSVVVGRAKLGGIPMGVIAVETRNVDRRIPADPANSDSREVVEPQAGQVWFPDSAFKTAQALKDFNRGENLPVMIFANWRGFSGGTRDMYGEVLKFGAQIVDALVDYKHPVFVYIPPGGELRGGSWVVIDPAINPEQMEMYADVESRGGILEPAGIVEVKFREVQQKQMMHRLDPKLKTLDTQLEEVSSAGDTSGLQEIESKIRAREEQLRPLYTQVACEFADLHDRTGRMEAKGVIRKGLEWKDARRFFYLRLKRRLLENEVIGRLVGTGLTHTEAKAKLEGWVAATGDEEAVAFLQDNPLEEALAEAELEATKKLILDLKEKLPADEAQKIFRAIDSFSAAPSSSSAKGPARPAAVTTDAEGRARFQVSKAASGKGKKGPEAAAAAPASAPTEAKEGVVTTDAEGRARFRAAEAAAAAAPAPAPAKAAAAAAPAPAPAKAAAAAAPAPAPAKADPTADAPAVPKAAAKPAAKDAGDMRSLLLE